jgi:hypothetical protein
MSTWLSQLQPQPELLQKRGLDEINGDLLDADFWPGWCSVFQLLDIPLSSSTQSGERLLSTSRKLRLVPSAVADGFQS